MVDPLVCQVHMLRDVTFFRKSAYEATQIHHKVTSKHTLAVNVQMHTMHLNSNAQGRVELNEVFCTVFEGLFTCYWPPLECLSHLL